MKYIIVLGDGMADEPMDVLGGKTPLEAAEKPAIDELAKKINEGDYVFLYRYISASQFEIKYAQICQLEYCEQSIPM